MIFVIDWNKRVVINLVLLVSFINFYFFAGAQTVSVVKDGVIYRGFGSASEPYATVTALNQDYIFPDILTFDDEIEIDNTIYKVTEVTPYAFANNKNLKKVKLGTNIRSVYNYAFSGSSISDIDLNKNVNVGFYAFEKTSNLKSIFLPENVGLGPFSFRSSGIKDVYVSKGVIIEHGALACPEMETLIFAPDYNGMIHRYTFGYNMVKELTIPGKMQVEDMAFVGFYNLERLVFKAGVDDSTRFAFATYLFYDSDNLKEVVCENPIPPCIPAEMFKQIQYQNSILKVPAGSIQLYKDAEGWTLFSVIEESAGVPDIEIEAAEIVSTEYYNIMGQKITSPALGQITIVRNIYSNGKVEIGKRL